MTPNKIIAVRNDRFGEFLLNIPVFRALKDRYPQAELVVVVNPYVKQLAERVPFIDRTFCWENKKHSLWEKIDFIRSLKKEKADIVLILNPSREFNFISFFAGIPIRAGYDRKNSFFLNRKMADTKEQGLKHETDYNLDLLKVIGINETAADFRGTLRIEDEDFPKDRMGFLGLEDKQFIVLHPWASNPRKEWGFLNFRRLAERLVMEPKYKLVLVGVKEDIKRSEQLSRDLSLIDLTGRTTLLELAGLLKRSRLLVTNDSGPMHLAAVMGVPTVALFRKFPQAISARRWGPVGPSHQIIESENIGDIQVSEVYDAVKKNIEK
ncbi:MAG: glycosyltransferase family 9 protein [Candidatus Omnitrophica bacterium]|nr:glycosyltransferase family 9 protein [Candidatus Omnitrophota bacterium]